MLFKAKPHLTPEQEDKKVRGFIKYIEDTCNNGNDYPFEALRDKLEELTKLNNKELRLDCYMRDGYSLEFYASGESDYAPLDSLSEPNRELIYDILLTISQTKP